MDATSEVNVLERYGLQFRDDIESEFRRYYLLKSITLDRVSLFGAGCLFYLFFLWDRVIDPMHWEATQAIRGLIVLPVLWIAGVSLDFPIARRNYEAILVSLGVFCTLALSIIY